MCPFLQEIKECCEALRAEAAVLEASLGPLLVLPLHAAVGRDSQKLYEDSLGDRARRVIVTHWLADAAFSVGSVRHIIDTGMELRNVSLVSRGERRRVFCGVALLPAGPKAETQ